MWDNVTLGRYLPSQTFFHPLHPVSKIGTIFMSSLGILLLPGLGGLLLATVYTGVLILLARSVWRYLLGGLRPLILIISITFIFQMFSVPGETLLSIGWLEITKQGLIRAINISGRLILVIVLTALLTLTTTPMALTYGLEKIFSPLKRLGLPAHELAMMISIALRFVPILLIEAETIMQAQRSRGTAFNRGGLIKRMKALLPLFIPLLATALRRAEELAMAMDARCYRGGSHRTRMNKFTVNKGDYLLMTSSLLFFILTATSRLVIA